MRIEIDDSVYIDLINATHSDELFAIASVNKDHLSPWLPWIRQMDSVDFINRFIEGSVNRNKTGTEYAFVIYSNNVMVGRIGLYKIDPMNHIGELGYWLTSDSQHKGIITKSCRKLIDFAIDSLGINRIEIRCDVNNRKSEAIPKRLNFVKEGVLRQAELFNNQYNDLVLYSLLKSDWKKNNEI